VYFEHYNRGRRIALSISARPDLVSDPAAAR